jgi:hypothetical protein
LESRLRDPWLARRFEQRLLAHMGKPVGGLVRNADELVAVSARPENAHLAISLDQTPD